MNRKLFFAIVFILMIGISAFQAFTVGQFFRVRGDFTPEPTWTLGHPGRVLFDLGVTNSGFTSVIDTDGYLSGAFWLGNVGWSVFNHGDAAVEKAKVLCADDVFRDPNITCPITGYAWSQNAGWIVFSGAEIDGSSGAYYNPASGRIEGFGYSEALGWVPFYADAATPISAASQTGVLFEGMGLNFIGRIAIIGNVAGTRIFNVTNQNVLYAFSSINHSEMLNTIRKNIALISRNTDPTELADPFNTKFDFMVQRGSDYDTRGGGWSWPSGKRSIIVVGADIILDESQIGLSTETERAMIALKDEDGNGGNIIVTGNVGRIYSFLYAEGTVYSADKTATGYIAPYITEGVWKIPANQLYIKGAVVSKNTVGGSLQNPSICPVVINNCTTTTAQIYDLNYFRSYDSNDITQKNVPYDDPRFGRASLVIEYNQGIATDPPPGLLSVFQ